MLKNILIGGLMAYGISACIPKIVTPNITIEQPLIVQSPKLEKQNIPRRHITWRTFSESAMQEGNKQNKLSILFIYDNSEDSKTMITKVFTDRCIIDQIEDNYVFIGVNIMDMPDAADFLKSKGMTSPTVIFILPNGEALPSFSSLPAKTYCQILVRFNEEFQKNKQKE